mmetsp:Transcript_28221/g.39906  ORF Transcript_28221/g.39906 Transcript_28221/m.39906 type:complete len:185 (-) Transcript_28221:22-576(-)
MNATLSSSNNNNNTTTTTIPAGSAIRNDLMVQMGVNELPFGGCGTSGYGNYHGEHSFHTFSNTQSRIYRPCFPGTDFGYARYHPYNKTWRENIIPLLIGLPKIPIVWGQKGVVFLGGVSVLCITVFMLLVAVVVVAVAAILGDENGNDENENGSSSISALLLEGLAKSLIHLATAIREYSENNS